jgi:hypothetical protein
LDTVSFKKFRVANRSNILKSQLIVLRNKPLASTGDIRSTRARRSQLRFC